MLRQEVLWWSHFAERTTRLFLRPRDVQLSMNLNSMSSSGKNNADQKPLKLLAGIVLCSNHSNSPFGISKWGR